MPDPPPWMPPAAVRRAAWVYSQDSSLEERERLDRLVIHARMEEVWEMLRQAGRAEKAGLVLLQALMSCHPAVTKRELDRRRRPYRTTAKKLREDATRLDEYGMPQEAAARRSAALTYDAEAEKAVLSDDAPGVVTRSRTNPLMRGFVFYFWLAIEGIFAERQRHRVVAIVANVLFDPTPEMTPRRVIDIIRRMWRNPHPETRP
jgi:hypothetical protein